VSFGTLMALLYSLHCTSYSSIHSWDITISGWEKQTSAILKFYFRFQFRPHHCIGDVVLHQAVEFYPNLISSVELWCYIDFQYGGRWGAILLPVSDWLSSLSSECQSLSENQISYSSISVWVISISGLKKNVRHIGIFLRAAILWPHHSNRGAIPHQATKFRPNQAIRCGVITSYTISRWQQRWLNTTTSDFVFDDVILFRR